MKDRIMFCGFLQGMRDMGAEFVKIKGNVIYFNILKGSKIDNEHRLQNAKKVFEWTFELKLVVRTVLEHEKIYDWPMVI